MIEKPFLLLGQIQGRFFPDDKKGGNGIKILLQFTLFSIIP
jgi:hypothetical protein